MYHSFLLNMPLGSIIQFFAQNNELISRNFQAFYSLDGEYELVDLDYEEAHRVSRETIEILNSYNFRDEEICELILSIHEKLEGEDWLNNHDTLTQVLNNLFVNITSPDYFISIIHNMSREDMISILVSTNPFYTFQRCK